MRQNAMLSDDKASKKWLEECFDMELGEVRVNNETGSLNRSGVAGRSCQVPQLVGVYAEYDGRSLRHVLPVRHGSVYAVRHCPQDDGALRASKTMDGKRDFVDLPLAVAGIRIEDSGVEYMPPEGNIPQCRAWIIDEYQDTNRYSTK